MKKEKKISSFQKLSREEKIEKLQSDLKVFENSKNILHKIYLLVKKKSNILNDSILNDIYSVLLGLLEGITDKNLGQQVDALKDLEKKLMQMKQEEDLERNQDLVESEKLLKQL